MTKPKFDQPLTTENKAIKYALGANLLLLIILFVTNNENNWGNILGLTCVSTLIIMGLCAYIFMRYRKHDLTRKKSLATKQLQEDTAALYQIKDRISKIALERSTISNNEQSEIKQRNTRHTQILQDLEKRRQTAATTHPHELSKDLADLQKRHIALGLQATTIKDAKIPGVGPKLKQRLASNGMTSAYDISKIRVSNISGFGVVKVRSVMAWKSDIENHLNQTKPSKLPPDIKFEIDSIYNQEYASIQVKRDAAEDSCELDLAQIKAKTIKMLAKNDQQEATALEESPQISAAVDESSALASIYKDITFLNFVKRCLDLDLEKPNL